jgi:hypothetical protein
MKKLQVSNSGNGKPMNGKRLNNFGGKNPQAQNSLDVLRTPRAYGQKVTPPATKKKPWMPPAIMKLIQKRGIVEKKPAYKMRSWQADPMKYSTKV